MLCFMNFWFIQFIENLLCGDIYNYYDIYWSYNTALVYIIGSAVSFLPNADITQSHPFISTLCKLQCEVSQNSVMECNIEYKYHLIT